MAAAGSGMTRPTSATAPREPVLTGSMVAKAFDLGEAAGPMIEIPGSTAHRTWRLDTFGATYFVKHYDRPWDMPTWSDWIRYIQGSWEIERAAYEAGLPVAEPVLAKGAAWPWLDLDIGERLATVRVHKWVAGTMRTDPASVAVATQLGDLLGRVHRLLPELTEWRRAPAWPEDWRAAAQVGDRVPRPWDRTFNDALPRLEEASELCRVAAAEKVRLVRTHRDLHSHNVIERPDGSVVVVDWDAASTQRADWELVETALELAGYISGRPDRNVVDAVVSSYHQAGGTARRITATSFAGLLMCSQNWLRYNVRRVASRQPKAPATGGDGDAVEREAVRSLAAVQRATQGIDQWLPWFQ
jgi:hypothetical protein